MSKKVDLSVKIGSVVLKNPIILASGSLGGTGKALANFADQGLAGVVSKTITKEPNKSNPQPTLLGRLRDQQPDLIINSEGLPNIGIDAFSKQVSQAKKGAKVIASIAGCSIEEFIENAKKMEEAGADILELNAACPHRFGTRFGHYWSSSPELITDLTRTVRKEVKLPIWVKFLTLGTRQTIEIAKAIERGGAEAIVPCTYLPTLPIDAETGKPMLGNVNGTGNETGPHMKFVGTKLVADIARCVKTPVVGTGGCVSGLDIVEYLMAGARAVQVITVFYTRGPKHARKMITEVEQYMLKKGFNTTDEIIGLTLKHLPPEPIYVF